MTFEDNFTWLHKTMSIETIKNKTTRKKVNSQSVIQSIIHKQFEGHLLENLQFVFFQLSMKVKFFSFDWF